MKIAVATGLVRTVSPDTVGGTEMFTHILTESLVKKGLDVTLFATSDSTTKAKLQGVCSSEQTDGIYEGPVEVRIPYEVIQAQKIISQSKDFDLIHNNYWHYYMLPAFSSYAQCPIITTIHNNFWASPNLKNILFTTHRRGKDVVVFLTKAAQAKAENNVDSVVINNGIDISSFAFSSKAEDYVLFLARIVPSKGIEHAVAAASQGNFSLTVAGAQSTRPDDKVFFEKKITPNFSSKIKYVGVPGSNKLSLYQNAKAFIFPAQAEEQFPLTVLEAMACGTPVIAYNRGALSEEVEDGVTGFIIDPDNEERPGKGSWIIKKQGIEGLVEAVNRIGEIDRANCRKRVEENFTRERMIEQYISLYNRLLAK